MWTRKMLKDNAKISLKRFYWWAVLACLILTVVGATANYSANRGDAQNLVYSFRTGDFGEFIPDAPEIGRMPDSDMYSMFGRSFFFVPLSRIMGFFIGVTAFSLAIAGIAFTLLVSNPLLVGADRFFMSSRYAKTNFAAMFWAYQKNFGNTVTIMLFRMLYTFLWFLLFIIPGIVKSYEYRMIPYILSENPDISKERAFALSRSMMSGAKWRVFELDLSFILWDILSGMTGGIVGIFWVLPYKQATFAELYAAMRTKAFENGFSDSFELPGFQPPAIREA